MGINKQKLTKDLEKWIESYSNAYCDKAADLLTEAARISIQNFYDSYKPLYYNRTDDLMNNSYKRYKHNNGKTIYGGVRISPDNMQPYGKTDAGTVLGMTFFHGYHGKIFNETYGYPYNVGLHYSYAPYYMMQQYMGSPKFHKNINDYATSVAKKQDYSILSKIF